MFKGEISADITTGTTIAILDNRISSKNKGERHFSSKAYKNEEIAKSKWEFLKKEITKKYNIEIINKEYPAIQRTRKEMEIKGVKND